MQLHPDVSRRAVLFGGLAAGMTAALSACGGGDQDHTEVAQAEQRTMTYGFDPRQAGVLTLPAGKVAGLAVLMHGGGWVGYYTPAALSVMVPALSAAGIATWNIDYRALGTGGGYPVTMEDVARAVDSVPKLLDHESRLSMDTPVVVAGHSAGAQLAAWAVSRTEDTPGGAPSFVPKAAVSMCGPLTLAKIATDGPKDTAKLVANFMGGEPSEVPEHYAAADPVALMPQAPVFVVRGQQDVIVPLWAGADYVSKVKARGGEATLVTVNGTHSSVPTPTAPTWPIVLKTIRTALTV